MERSREGRRSGLTTVGAVSSATRRPRIKDTSDDEERMDETVDARSWERSKKERLASFHVSSSMNPRNKRKRQLLSQEAQSPGGRLNAGVEDASESVEETEAQVSEDDDEPPPPPLMMRRPGTGKVRGQSKEDDIVMDIPAVPRKARSSMSASSRYSSMARRQLDSQPPELPRQKPATPSQIPLNGTSSTNFLQKPGRKLKPVGPKVRAIKVPKAADVSTLSDKEAEVAEVLFDLSRSLPSHSNVLESKVEVKLESETRNGSSPSGHALLVGASIHGLHHPATTANGYVASFHSKDVNASPAEAPKRKRPRVVVKAEDGKISTPVRLVSSVALPSSASPSRPHQSCVDETEIDSVPEKAAADVASLPSDPLNGKGVTDAAVCETHSACENEEMEQGEIMPSKQEPQIAAERKEALVDRPGEAAVTADLPRESDANSTSELASRPIETLCEDGSSAKLNIDLMASPLKYNAVEDDAIGSRNDRQNVGGNSVTTSAPCNGRNHAEDQAKSNSVPEGDVKAVDVAIGLPMIKEKADGVEHQDFNHDGEKHQVLDRLQMAQAAPEFGKEEEEEEKDLVAKTKSRPQEEVSDNAVTAPFVASTMPAATSSSTPVPFSGWMGGLSHLGYYGPGAPPWAAGVSLPNSGIDVKAVHSALQLPHGAVLPLPVQRMKRCASHVFIAYFIYRDQQLSRQSLWSAALCRAAPYNLNIPPVNILDNDKLSGHYLDAARKSSTQQSGPSYGYTISQGGGPGMTGSSTHGTTGATPGANHVSNAVGSGDTGSTSVTGTSSNVMATHAQYLQAMMQQNGFASFSFPFNGPHGQTAQFFNTPFFQPHLMHPPIPQVQAITQQSGNVLKQQQGAGSLPHSNSQLITPPLQQQLQLQLAPQSPSQSQQPHNNVGMSVQQFGIHSDKELAHGMEIASTGESRLSAIQRNVAAQHSPSNLPNLNISASPLMLGTSLPGMTPHDQDGSSLAPPGGKHSGKGQSHYLGQNPSLLSSSMQPQQLTTGSASGPQMKVLDTTLSQGYPTLGRGPVSGTLGLVSSMMGTPNLGVLPVSVDGSKSSGQQQPVYGGHGQHFPRSMTKASVSDEAYAIKARDYKDDKRNSMKPVGGPALISRVDMEVSSPSLQGSPTSGSGASNARMAGGMGRTLNSGTTSDVRSSRPATSAGSGQVPLLQNQQLAKQAMGRAKTVSSGANVSATPIGTHSVAAYAEKVLPGNLGKFAGTGLPYSGQIPLSSQNSKPVHTGVTKVGHRVSPGSAQQQTPNPAMTKNHVQQSRSNQPGVPSTPPRMLPSVTAPVLPGGAISMSTQHSLSMSKALSVTTSKSPSNGKGAIPMTKAGPPSKKPPVSGTAISSGLSPVQQSMSSRTPAQQKVPASALHVPQFHQQQSAISAQQQRLPTTKIQGYPQLQAQQGQYKQPFPAQSSYRPQLFLQQPQQQYMQQQPPQQQQAVPQHHQASVSQQYLQTPQSASQHSQGHVTTSASSDGVGLKTNPTKMGYASASPLATGVIPETISTAHSMVSGQVSSPLVGSSPYLQLAAVKPSESKPLVSDVAIREDVASSRHLSSPSSSQAPVASNPGSSS